MINTAELKHSDSSGLIDKQNKRLVELDYIRVISMFAVILLHTSSTYIFSETRFAICGINAAYILNQVTRFAVPMFVLLSGISLSLSQKNVSCISFLKKRAVRIIIPYMIWCAVYYLYRNSFSLTALGTKGALTILKEFGRGLLLGNLAPHLYFVVIIVQLYLLYFIIEKALSISRTITLIVSFAITAFFQTAIYLTCFDIRILPGFISTYAWFLFPSWLFYFTAGVSLNNVCLGGLERISKKYLWLFAALTGIFAVLLVIDGTINNSFELSIRPVIIPYVMLAFMLFYGLAGFLKKSALLNRNISWLAQQSYLVYLCHVLFLYIFRNIEWLSRGMLGMLVMFIIVTVISILTAWLFGAAIKLLKGIYSFKSDNKVQQTG